MQIHGKADSYPACIHAHHTPPRQAANYN